MSLSRRTFLKGMAAVSAIPIIGFPKLPVKADEFDPIPLMQGLFWVYCHVKGMEFSVRSEHPDGTETDWSEALALPDHLRGFGNDVTPTGRCIYYPVAYGDTVVVSYGKGKKKTQLIYEGGPMEMYVGTDGPYPKPTYTFQSDSNTGIYSKP